MLKSYLEQVEETYGTAVTDDLHRVIFKHLSKKHFPSPTDKKVLDVGIGLGHCAVALRELGCLQISGVDMDDRAFPRLNDIGIQTAKCDISKEPIPYPDNAFDIIVAFHVLEHLSDPAHFLAEIHRVLSNKGVLLLATPDWQRYLKKFYDDETHVRPYSRKGLTRLLSRSGFEKIDLTGLEVFRWGLYHTRLWKLFPSLCFTGRVMLFIGRKAANP